MQSNNVTILTAVSLQETHGFVYIVSVLVYELGHERLRENTITQSSKENLVRELRPKITTLIRV